MPLELDVRIDGVAPPEPDSYASVLEEGPGPAPQRPGAPAHGRRAPEGRDGSTEGSTVQAGPGLDPRTWSAPMVLAAVLALGVLVGRALGRRS